MFWSLAFDPIRQVFWAYVGQSPDWAKWLDEYGLPPTKPTCLVALDHNGRLRDDLRGSVESVERVPIDIEGTWSIRDPQNLSVGVSYPGQFKIGSLILDIPWTRFSLMPTAYLIPDRTRGSLLRVKGGVTEADFALLGGQKAGHEPQKRRFTRTAGAKQGE